MASSEQTIRRLDKVDAGKQSAPARRSLPALADEIGGWITLVGRDPKTLFCQWHVSQAYLTAAKTAGGRDLRLRLYAHPQGASQPAPQASTEVPCEEGQTKAYLLVPTAGERYVAELGYVGKKSWLPLVRSQAVTPPAGNPAAAPQAQEPTPPPVYATFRHDGSRGESAAASRDLMDTEPTAHLSPPIHTPPSSAAAEGPTLAVTSPSRHSVASLHGGDEPASSSQALGSASGRRSDRSTRANVESLATVSVVHHTPDSIEVRGRVQTNVELRRGAEQVQIGPDGTFCIRLRTPAAPVTLQACRHDTGDAQEICVWQGRVDDQG